MALKVALATGTARRFMVGDPDVHYVDTLAGATVARSAEGEHLAEKGDVIADEATVTACGDRLTIREWRSAPDSSDRYAVVAVADAILADTVPLARASGDLRILSRALHSLGSVNFRLGNMDTFVAALEESLSLAQAISDVPRELAALNGIGVAYMHTDGDRAERLLTEVLTRAAAVGNRERIMIALANLGVLADERAATLRRASYHQQARHACPRAGRAVQHRPLPEQSGGLRNRTWGYA